MDRVVNLPHHAQAVGGIAGLKVCVHSQRRLELAHGDGVLQADDIEAVAQHFQGALGVQGLAQAFGQYLVGVGAVA